MTLHEWLITLAYWVVVTVGYGMLLFGWFMGPAS